MLNYGLNPLIAGYYRVNYEEALWNYIIDYLNSDMYSHINKLNRAQLIDDSFNLARSGRLSYEIPLNLTKYLVRERDYLPFYSFFSALTFLNTELAGSEYYNRFQVGQTLLISEASLIIILIRNSDLQYI